MDISVFKIDNMLGPSVQLAKWFVLDFLLE